MMSSRRCIGLTIVSSFVLLAGCSVADYGKGRLIIVGSGLRADEAPIHLAFTKAAGATATILVLPTDTGLRGRSDPTAQNLAPFAAPGQTVRVVELGGDAPEFGSDPQYVGELESAQAFWFAGGGQIGIVSVFRPESGDTPAYEAVTRALKRGGVVAGTAAAAAMMSDPMIVWGNSQEALLVGARDIEGRAVALQKGMGFFPYGIVDPHFLAGGHLGRLVAALESTSDVRGYGVAGDRALMVDIGRSHGTAIGAAAVVVIDISQLRRDGLNRFGLRLALMGDQDGIALQSGALIPAAGKTPLAPTGPAGNAPPSDPGSPTPSPS